MSKVIGKVEKYDGRIFKCQEMAIELSDGTIITRNLVEKSSCVVALVRHKSRNTVFLTEEFRVGSLEEELGFVAGIVDEGEIDDEAVVRELEEETGYPVEQVESIHFLGEGLTSSGFTNEKISYYYIEVDGEPKEQKLDHDERIKLIEVQFDDMLSYMNNGTISGNHAQVCTFKYLMNQAHIHLQGDN